MLLEKFRFVLDLHNPRKLQSLWVLFFTCKQGLFLILELCLRSFSHLFLLFKQYISLLVPSTVAGRVQANLSQVLATRERSWRLGTIGDICCRESADLVFNL